jgi:hypothetical protein
MSISSQSRLLVTWFALCAITLLAWWIGAHHGSGPLQVDPAVGLSAMAITLVKVRVIIREFMDVRHAPAKLKWLTDGWLVVFIVALAITYLAV